MPKIVTSLPAALFQHLRERMLEREINAAQLTMLAEWISTNPEVPAGRWFKRFPELIVCGEGELIKTFLRRGQVAEGEEVY